MLKKKIGTLSQHKWICKLLGYEFTIEYKKGKENVAANALSKSNEVIEEEACLSTIIVLDPMRLEQLKTSYLHDEELSKICTKLQEGFATNQTFQ